MPSHHGIKRTASGGVNVSSGTPDKKSGGVATVGEALAVNALAGAVPAGTFRRDGIAFDPNGKMCTTTSAAGATLKNGILTRDDGAVVTVATGPTSASRMVHTPIGSFLVDANGAIHTG